MAALAYRWISGWIYFEHTTIAYNRLYCKIVGYYSINIEVKKTTLKIYLGLRANIERYKEVV